MDRSYINDPKMDVGTKGFAAEISPVSGLTSGNKSSGGNACSVCAH